MNRRNQIVAAVLTAILLAAPAADARKARNTDWEAWNQERQTFCAFVAAIGFRMPRVCRAG